MVLNIISVKKLARKINILNFNVSITSFFISRIIERHYKYIVIASLNVHEFKFFDKKKNHDENQNYALRYDHKISPDHMKKNFCTLMKQNLVIC